MTVTYLEYFWADQYTNQIHEADKFSKFVLPNTLKMHTPWPCLFLDFFVKHFTNLLSLHYKKLFFVKKNSFLWMIFKKFIYPNKKSIWLYACESY